MPACLPVCLTETCIDETCIRESCIYDAARLCLAESCLSEQCLAETCIEAPVCRLPSQVCINASRVCTTTAINSVDYRCGKPAVKIKPVADSTRCLTKFPGTITLESNTPSDAAVIWKQIAGYAVQMSATGNRMTASIARAHPQGYEFAAFWIE